MANLASEDIPMKVSETLLPEFDEEMASTRKFLELVPDEKLGWKPHEKSMALGQLAWHVSEFPSWCCTTLKQDSLTLTQEDTEKTAAARKGKGRKEMLSGFDESVKEARTRLAAVDEAALAANWKMIWGDQTLVDMPRGQVLRKWVMNHLVHHRAQLGVYLRLNGIPIPGVYGPSADEMPS
jgi:uncharacterized damage-inducible protein DinB